MKTKMRDIKVEMRKLQIKENDLLIVKISDEVDVEGAEAIGEAVAEAVKELGTECGMLVISPAMDLSTVSEEFMEQFGWYKKHTADDVIDELF
jgi:hypothetical protein